MGLACMYALSNEHALYLANQGKRTKPHFCAMLSMHLQVRDALTDTTPSQQFQPATQSSQWPNRKPKTQLIDKSAQKFVRGLIETLGKMVTPLQKPTTQQYKNKAKKH